MYNANPPPRDTYRVDLYNRIVMFLLLPALGWVPILLFIHELRHKTLGIVVGIAGVLGLLMFPIFLMMAVEAISVVRINADGITRSLFGLVLERLLWNEIRIIKRSIMIKAGQAIDILPKPNIRIDGVFGRLRSAITLTNIDNDGQMRGLLSRLAKEHGVLLTSQDPVDRYLTPDELEVWKKDGLPIEWL